MAAALNGPMRTCIGCRHTDSRSVLLRVVVGAGDGGQAIVLPDPAKRVPGRGAWLHPTDACYEMALRRRAFGRALRIAEPADATRVRDHLVQLGVGDDQ